MSVRHTRPSSARRRSDPLVVLVSGAVTVAMMLLVLWQWLAVNAVREAAPTVSSPAAARPTTPVWSVRRAPEVLTWRLQAAALDDALAPLVTALDATSCLAVALDGRVVAATGSDVAVLPGSTQKLLTAAVALQLLGPQFRFTTKVFGPAPINGVVPGDVVVVGGGDPLLSTAAWPTAGVQRYPPFGITPVEGIADALAGSGITRIAGRVVGDGSRYDDEWFHPTWSPDLHGAEAGPVDALVVDDSRENAAVDPAQFAATVVTDVLRGRGIAVDAAPAAFTADTSLLVELASIQSVPLAEVVAEMLTTSDNTTAEMLMKEIGLQVTGLGTWASGAAVVADTVRSWVSPAAAQGLAVTDGSGLSRDNRATCALLVELLHREGPTGDLATALPVAAVSGTLVDQFGGTPLAGRLAAKTGTLSGVKALAGFVLPPDGTAGDADPLEFALVLNTPGVDDGAYEPVWNDLLAPGLASHPNGPSADLVAPVAWPAP